MHQAATILRLAQTTVSKWLRVAALYCLWRLVPPPTFHFRPTSRPPISPVTGVLPPYLDGRESSNCPWSAAGVSWGQHSGELDGGGAWAQACRRIGRRSGRPHTLHRRKRAHTNAAPAGRGSGSSTLPVDAPWELTGQLEVSVKHVKLGGAGCLVGLGHILQAMWWVEPTVLNRTSKAGTAAGSRSGQARSNTIKRAWVSSNK